MISKVSSSPPRLRPASAIAEKDAIAPPIQAAARSGRASLAEPVPVRSATGLVAALRAAPVNGRPW